MVKRNICLTILALVSSITLSASFSPTNLLKCKKHPMTKHNAAKPLCTFEASDFALPTGEWPYSAADLNRLDNSDDSYFYDVPRFVTHIDDRAIESLKEFYREDMSDLFKEKKSPLDVIDLCSSWISHFPDDVPFNRVVGVGMNEEELKENSQLTEYLAKDLNKNPDLSEYDDSSFDVLCNVVSVDYLTDPLSIFKETHRILRPGGRALISFSNRCFPSKAVAMWLQADDIGRLTIVGSYFHYAAEWKSIEALDIKLPPVNSPKRPSVQEIMANPGAAFAWASATAVAAGMNNGDPMFMVRGVK